MATEPITGGTGLPEERSKLPLVQTEQQAGITETPATLPTGTEVSPEKLEVGTEELMTKDWREGYGETVGLEKKRARNENAHVQPLLVLDEQCLQFQSEKCTWS